MICVARHLCDDLGVMPCEEECRECCSKSLSSSKLSTAVAIEFCNVVMRYAMYYVCETCPNLQDV